MPENSRFLHSPDVIFQQVAGELVLMDLESEQYFGLDAVGARIWELLGQGSDLDAVQATLLEEYDAEASRLRHDLQQLVDDLLQAGLLRPAS